MTDFVRRSEGGDVLLAALERHGLRTLFSVSGGPINSAYHASTRRNVRILHTRHEAAAGFMADSVYRSTGQFSGALVTLGPGVTNVVTPAACAMSAGVPFIIIGGQAPTHLLHKGAGMEFDTMSIMSQVTKWSVQVLHPDRIEEFVDEAVRRMLAGVPGPVYLEIPTNVLSAHAELSKRAQSAESLSAPVGVAIVAADQVRNLVSQASRPLIIAGDGVHHNRAESRLTALSTQMGVPVSTLRLARGAIDETQNENWIGPAYIPANAVFAEALATADLVLLLGHHWEFDLEFGQTVSPETTVIQVHYDPSYLGRNGPLTLGICADAGQFLAVLENLELKNLDQDWPKRLHKEWLEHREASVLGTSESGDSPHPIEVIDEVSSACPPETRFVTSHGNVDFWADGHLSVRQPRGYLRVGQSGALGAEIPFGVASAIVSPTVASVVFVGDGAVGYHITELETAARENAPVVIVVMDDHLWGAIALPQQKDYGVQVEMELPERDWAKVAEGLGAVGERVGLNNIGDAVAAAITRGGPTLLQINVRSVLSPYMRHISS